MVFALIAGVLLPAIAIVFEILTRFCSFLFDPFPTTWHLVLLGLVPVGNLLALWTCMKADRRLIAPATLLAGVSAGVALAYSIVFLPMLPISVVGIIVYGLGLLGLSPFFALASSLLCTYRLGRLQPSVQVGRRLVWVGISVGLLPILLYALAGQMTSVGLRMAASKNETRSQRGVAIIRTYGSGQELLRACYELPVGFWIWTETFPDRVPREQARDIYYRVTGEPFNSVPPPRLAEPRTPLIEDAEFDSDVGGNAVNGIVRSVSLASSMMDSTVDPHGLTVYSEWTMEFRNTASVAREARAEIALPPGAVVSRLTLWVKGKEREAAFAGRGIVRQAYQQIAVVYRRDPVLVTTCGPDRVLMQCFPVPPKGGKMKVRLGITSPLLPDGSDYTPPRFVERNFTVSSKDTAEPIRRRGPNADTTWTPDPANPTRYAIVQTLRETEAQVPKSLVVVVDSSRKVGDARQEIADAIAKLPSDCRFSVIRAGEQVTELVPIQSATAESLRDASRQVEGMRFFGGIDNVPALLKAYNVAQKGGAILWIHGPQPFSSDARSRKLLGLYRHRPNSPPIYAVVAGDGRNSVLADLEQTGAMSKIAGLKDLERVFAGWSGERKQMVAVRERVSLQNATGLRVSQQMAKLWARDEVMSLCREKHIVQAIALASRYRLVTPVTGAVVLENDQQYRDSGLTPPTPIVTPEPATWLALAAGAAFVGLGRIRRRPATTSR